MTAFDITMLDRDDAQLYRELKRIMKKNGQWREYLKYTSHLEDRAELKAHIEASTVEGQVCRYEWGMDCDCVSYSYERNIPAPTVMAFVRERDSMYEWADGPCNLGIGKPVEEPYSHSRDLAMEAYENGHPHVVYA
jgi:hypothetical protein